MMEQQSCRSKQDIQTSAHVSIVEMRFSISIRLVFLHKINPQQMTTFDNVKLFH